MLHIETIDLTSVISDYFEVKSPFGINKDKKSEFPDAFNISMLRKYAFYNRPVVIGNHHWGEYGRYKEFVLMQTLRNYLPDTVALVQVLLSTATSVAHKLILLFIQRLSHHFLSPVILS